MDFSITVWALAVGGALLTYGALAAYLWKAAGKSAWPAARPRVRRLLWIIGLASVLHVVLGANGAFTDMQALPPVVLVAALITTAIWIGLAHSIQPLLAEIGLARISGFQIWRIFPELLILSLFAAGQMPAIMTAAGGNFDLFAPLTALPIAWWIARTGADSLLGARIALVWHIIAGAILLNTLYHAVGATPAVALFNVSPPNTAPGFFPVNLLPGLMVPLALVSHWIGANLAWRAAVGRAAGRSPF